MTDKQNEFLDHMFRTLTGSEYVAGSLWRTLYPEKCEALLRNIKNYYETFERVFGTPKLTDINQMIFVEIIDIVISIDVSNIESVSKMYRDYFCQREFCCD